MIAASSVIIEQGNMTVPLVPALVCLFAFAVLVMAIAVELTERGYMTSILREDDEVSVIKRTRRAERIAKERERQLHDLTVEAFVAMSDYAAGRERAQDI